MRVNLVKADLKKKDVLRKMLLAYQREIKREKQPEEYKYLDNYWKKNNHFPFFITVNDEIAGFILVNDFCIVEKGSKSVSEFFVKEEYRHQEIGRQAAKMTFDLFPGKWEIRQLANNFKAQAFWKAIIKDYTDNNFKEILLDNKKWHGPMQIFDNSKLARSTL